MKAFLVLAFVLAAAPALAQDAGLVFAALDVNHDGKVTRAEAQKNAVVIAAFDQADKNKDGSLSKAEFEAAFGR